MNLSRIDLADMHSPSRIAAGLHDQLGRYHTAIPVLEIARALDIEKIRLNAFDGFEGMLLTDRVRSRGAILANTSRGQRCARFTVAHELGHFLMEQHELSTAEGFRCRTSDMRETRADRQHQRQESQANQFAIELLAPNHNVDPSLSGDPDIRDAQRLRDSLNISLEAAARRLIDRRDECLATVWTQSGRIRALHRGIIFPWIVCGPGDKIAATTHAFRAISNGSCGFTDFAEVSPEAWTDRSEIELWEQTRVGKDGHALTLLWATLPDEEPADDLEELGTPQFR